MSVWSSRLTIEDPSDFDSRIKEISDSLADDEQLYVLFTGAKDEKGVSWCPDCTAADPVLEKALNEYDGKIKLVVCPCKRSESKGNDKYLYRRHKGIRLKCVPTIGRWVNGRLEFRLEEEQCQNAEFVNETLEEEM